MSDHLTQVSSQLGESFQESTSALEGPLTQEQLENIRCIGNKRLSSHLYKRNLKIWSREERLRAIEFCRTRKHVNPLTGQERPISISTASHLLHVESGTLKKWILNEKQIIAMKPGSQRADGQRKSVSKKTYQDASDCSFLLLQPSELFKFKFISSENFPKVLALQTR